MPAPLSTILVASDGSDESRLAIDRAVRLAQQDDAELHLVHVGLLSKWVQPDTLSPKQYERIKQEAQDRLDVEVAYAEERGGTVTEAHRRMGKADSEIIELSEKLDADLIPEHHRAHCTRKRLGERRAVRSLLRHGHPPAPVVT